jgi:nitroreductase
MSFVLALETLGLASCCINWPDVESRERGMASLLRLEPDERVVMLIALGYPDPDAMVPASGKKSLDTVRRYNQTG